MKPLYSPPHAASPRRGGKAGRCRLTPDKGVTLVELLVVLAVLVALGGIVATTVNRDVRILVRNGETEGEKEYQSADEVVTRATMQAVRDALLGTSASDPGYRGDLGALPSRLGGLLIREPSLVFAGPDEFNPATKRGWRGPYIVGSGTRYGDRIALDVTVDGFPTTDPDDPTPASILDDPAIVDAWGKPIVLQVPRINNVPEPKYSRIVSAGPSRNLDTDRDDVEAAARGDDLVIFLFSFDPNL